MGRIRIGIRNLKIRSRILIRNKPFRIYNTDKIQSRREGQINKHKLGKASCKKSGWGFAGSPFMNLQGRLLWISWVAFYEFAGSLFFLVDLGGVRRREVPMWGCWRLTALRAAPLPPTSSQESDRKQLDRELGPLAPYRSSFTYWVIQRGFKIPTYQYSKTVYLLISLIWSSCNIARLHFCKILYIF